MEAFPLRWKLVLLICLLTARFGYGGHAHHLKCNASHREALLDFKLGLVDFRNQLSSWRYGSNCCEWKGIDCDNNTGAVISIDFHPSFSYRFGGNIRPSLAKIKSLRRLDLRSNSFNSTTPDFLSSFENLEYLNLADAGFSGAIPTNLGNLSCLEFLDVSDNPFLTVDNLEFLTGLVSLKYLAMGEVDLSKVGLGWAESLNKLPLLTELHLARTGLQGFSPSLPLVNFTSLAILDLSSNYMPSKLPNWLANISSLVSVDISNNNLYGSIPLGLGELPKLQSLQLSHNQNLSANCSQLFNGSWKKIQLLDLQLTNLYGRLPDSLGNMTSLLSLDLSNHGIEGGIPKSIGRLCDLQNLDLSGNNLTEGLPEFLEVIDNWPCKSPLPSLQHFVCSSSRLGGRLPSWLGHLKNLSELDLSYNMLQGPIPTSFGYLQHLQSLRLQSNMLNGTLPDSLGLLSELTTLLVSNNQLSGIISEAHFLRLGKLISLHLSANSLILNVSSNWVPPFQVHYLYMGSCLIGPSLPTWLRSQQEIWFLDFSNASISGSIPNWFWDMSSNLVQLNFSLNHLVSHLPNPFNILGGAYGSLLSLDLSNNQFFGPIPEKIGNIMPNLEFLSLSRNQLTGAIPSSLELMSYLSVVDLSKNNFTGGIPLGIGNCSSLVALDLQNNNLSGEIPGSLSQLTYLRILHLGNNKFSGEIPSNLHILSRLETLDLGNNRLTGNIPSWIGEAFAQLRILVLRTNNLFGELPSTISNLSRLQVLDLAENKFNGTIPATLGDLEAMVQMQTVINSWGYSVPGTAYYQENIVLNINGQGQLYTKTLSLVTSIDLSGNNLCGELPQELTKLAGLLVLNLSRNHISGQIPNKISELHQLLSLDLSNNRFSGPIPPSISSLTFLESLNLSSNNLSGEIPLTNQMETFSASSFSGNPGLYGCPLAVKCSRDYPNKGRFKDDPNDGEKVEGGDGDGFIDKWFYMSVGLGFAAGLLVPYLIFAIKRSWGGVYFAAVDRVVCIFASEKIRRIIRSTYRRH